MDAIDILGELLGQKTSQSSRGGNVLQDIFQRRSAPTQTTTRHPSEIHREAQELEDLLGVANKRTTQRRSAPPQREAAPAGRNPFEFPRSSGQPTQPKKEAATDNDKALVLIRAMVNAAKADGKLDRQEQQAILERLGSQSREAQEFLRGEFEGPLDLEGFIRTIPLGMEQQVYSMSLIGMDLDTRGEANYLQDLAKGLRLDPSVCNQINQQYGAPEIFSV